MDSPQDNTNYIPSDEEIKSIRLDIVSRSEELARIDERIYELSAQRDEIQASIDAQKALISHPRRLPADIVREIFIACLPTRRNAVMSTQEAPLLLCRICSAWRTIALSTPRLWASLHVPADFILAKEPRMPAVVQWLQRSGACPISISVCDPTWNWQDQWLPDHGDEGSIAKSTRWAALIKSLGAFSSRWRHTKFKNMSQIGSLASESFEFDGYFSTLAQLNFFDVPACSLGPRHHLVLDLPLVWNRIQHLDLAVGSGLTLSSVIDLLGQCPQLISVHIAPNADDRVGAVASELFLPFLESFILSGYFTLRSLSHFITHVSMPQLRQFEVSSGSGTDETHGFFLSLPETLRSFPCLTRLSVFDAQIWGWANDYFQPSSVTQLLNLLTDTTVCPDLRELVVDCPVFGKGTVDAFIQRRLESHLFRRLEVSFQPYWTSEAKVMSEAEIESYLSQGLEISFILPDPWTGLCR
ncbi:hypothetical protein K438DRAFT_1822931 [Mycena galopus ATCC 62051]|nr:hypothetical protein K438DRAFT_1822931 [Mycena galopus ATCC 62051]